MKGRRGIVLGAANEEARRRTAQRDASRFACFGAVDVCRQRAWGRVEDDGDVRPLILHERFRRSLTAHGSAGNDGRAEAFAAGHREQPIGGVAAEIEERSGRTRRQEQPTRDAKGVFTRQRFRGDLQVATVARQQQHVAKERILDEAAAAAAHRGMEMVSGRVFRISAEQVPRREPGFTDAVEELIATLTLIGRRAGEGEQQRRSDRRQPCHFATPNVNTVRVWYSAPGRSVVDGKFGLFGESG